MIEQPPKQTQQSYNPHIGQQQMSQHQEQLSTWADEGGRIQDGYVEEQSQIQQQGQTQQGQIQVKETQIKETKCPVAEQPVSYTEEAKRMEMLNKEFDQAAKLVDNKLAEQDTLAHERCTLIKGLESDAQKAQEKLMKEQEIHQKEQSKLQSEFEKQQLKTVQMAEELSAKRAEQQRIEAEHAREAMDKDEAARNLAEQLAAERTQHRQYVEKQILELDEAEGALKQKILRLSEQQNKEVAELELKERSMKASVEVARKNMDELKRRHEHERQEFETMQSRLGMLRAQAFAAHKQTEEHMKERERLLEKVRELDLKMGESAQRATVLDSEKEQLQQELLEQQQDLRLNQSALSEQEQMLEKKREARQTLELHAKTQLQNEELALKKAQELQRKIEEEKRDLEKDLSRLNEEEHQTKRLVAGGRLNEVEVEQRVIKDNFQKEVTKTEECVGGTCETTEHSEDQTTTEGKGILGTVVDVVVDTFLKTPYTPPTNN